MDANLYAQAYDDLAQCRLDALAAAVDRLTRVDVPALAEYQTASIAEHDAMRLQLAHMAQQIESLQKSIDAQNRTIENIARALGVIRDALNLMAR